MKIPSSNYIGTPEKWVRFLQEWARRKQVDIDASSRQGFSFPGYLDTFPFEAPASLKHFMAAYEFLGKPKLLEVAEISGHFFEILNPLDVNLLPLVDRGFFDATECDDDAKVPIIASGAEYCKDYREEQFSPVLSSMFLASYVIGKDDYSGFDYYLLSNPLVRSEDGEWEACYLEIDGAYTGRYQCFADLVVNIFIASVFGYTDEMRNKWMNHKNDPSGLSKILFKS